MLHEGNALWLETFALFAHPDAYRSIPSHRSTWGICVEEAFPQFLSETSGMTRSFLRLMGSLDEMNWSCL